MTRSEIFTLAHSIAKNTKASFSSYRLAFATALTIAYSQSKQVTEMKNTITLKDIVELRKLQHDNWNYSNNTHENKAVNLFLKSTEDIYFAVKEAFGYQMTIEQICYLNGSSKAYNKVIPNENEVIFSY